MDLRGRGPLPSGWNKVKVRTPSEQQFSWRRVALVMVATPAVVTAYVVAEIGDAIRRGVQQGMNHCSALWDEATRL